MTDRTDDIQSAFRLNLEQQKKRAKDLLKGVQAQDTAALARITRVIDPARLRTQSHCKLADAQFVIARELGFSSWAELKSHITAMQVERNAASSDRAPLDGDATTLHIRCGSDIRATLSEAGFAGDFFEHSNPYCQGPLTQAADDREQRARFIADSYGSHLGQSLEAIRAALAEEDQRLADSARDYGRVVL